MRKGSAARSTTVVASVLPAVPEVSAEGGWLSGALNAIEGATGLDLDGDGKPNTLLELHTQWKGWRPYLVKQLRHAIGEESIMIANTAGPMSLEGLNGVTIEMEWCGTDMAACLAAMAVSGKELHYYRERRSQLQNKFKSSGKLGLDLARRYLTATTVTTRSAFSSVRPYRRKTYRVLSIAWRFY